MSVLCNLEKQGSFTNSFMFHENITTVESQWLEHLWDYGNVFETWVVRATEG